MTRLEQHTVAALLDAIAEKTPAPGGGAVASSTGATSAALASMVVAYSLGKKNLAEHQPVLERSAQALIRARQMFLELAEEDAAAYSMLNELQKLPETDPRRGAEMPNAIAAALAPPRAATAAAADLLRLIESLAPITNKHLRSDLAIAAVLAEAAAKAGAWNVAANLSLIGDPKAREAAAAEARGLVADARSRCAAVEAACRFEGM